MAAACDPGRPYFNTYLQGRVNPFLPRVLISGVSLRFGFLESEKVVKMQFRWLPALILLAGEAAWAAKADTVVLENGNLVTGEIKQLESGKLRYSTDSMGTVMIEWDEITRIASALSFTIETRDGARYFGSIASSTGTGVMIVSTRGGEHTLSMEDVVKIRRIKDTFFDRLDTYVSGGYSYTKATDVSELNFGINFSYPSVSGETELDVGSRITDDGEDESKFNQVTFVHQHFRPRRNYWVGIGAFEQNDELGLDYRLGGYGGLGKNIVQSNLQQLSMDIGAGITQTKRNDGGSDQNLEGLWRTSYRIFDYDTPKTDLSTTLVLLPGITNSGEYRVNYDISLRKELIKDLFIDLSFYYRYDSDVPDDDSNDDYGVVTAIGIGL